MDDIEYKRGCRYGGISICHHSNIRSKVETIATQSKCICAQKITIDDIILLHINVYMPNTDNNDDLEIYSNILHEISSICIRNIAPMIIIGGDWNADPRRNDGRTRLFNDFIRQENLFIYNKQQYLVLFMVIKHNFIKRKFVFQNYLPQYELYSRKEH